MDKRSLKSAAFGAWHVTELEKSRPSFSPHNELSLSTSPRLPATSNNEEGSMVLFGGVDPSYYRGDLKWVPVTQRGFWQISMDR